MDEQAHSGAVGARPIPRPFAFHWGKGMVVEEASIETPYTEPTIQLLEYEDGSETVRFCYYHGPRFGRGPAMMDADALDDMREALKGAPRLRALLRRLTED